MKIAILYNQGNTYNRSEEVAVADADTDDSARSVYTTLRGQKHNVQLIKLTPHTLDRINTIETDVVFNLCEWSGKDYQLGVRVIQLLEKKGLPYTGADAASYEWGSDKTLMKQMFLQNRIPTPRWFVLTNRITQTQLKLIETFSFPVILKPAYDHCSIGIHQSSIIQSAVSLKQKIDVYYNVYEQPIIIEEYIHGREIHITAVRNGVLRILPPAEILFLEKPGFEKIFSFESKWSDDSQESVFAKTIVAEINTPLLRRIKNLTKRVFNNMGCRGYIRVDIRLSNNEPFVLEVNVNPGIDPDPEYGMSVSSHAAGWSFDRLIGEIIKTVTH